MAGAPAVLVRFVVGSGMTVLAAASFEAPAVTVTAM